MDLRQIAKDTTKTLISYLTYQAVRTVIGQLRETDPPRSFWLHQFSSRERIQDGEVYVQTLFKEQPDLAFRILTVREHLAEEIADYLPEMLRSTMQQSNIEQRRQQLERMTQIGQDVSDSYPEESLSTESPDSEMDGS
ncbi:RuBisCO chaperone RbcX [Egbenema bharatensis]|uniref:RuBisCO chaperone RbcX n=1 Tax=Egbenema bharatensis TaxID=3463334 RepID=UPI003A8BD740